MIKPGVFVKLKEDFKKQIPSLLGYIVSVTAPDSDNPLYTARVNSELYINFDKSAIDSVQNADGQMLMFW